MFTTSGKTFMDKLMKKSLSAFVVTTFLFLSAIYALALPADEMKSADAQGLYAGGMKNTDAQGLYTGGVKQGIPLEELGQVPGRASIDAIKGLSSDKDKLSTESLAKKAKIILKAEPGDGLVSLSWVIKGFPQQPGEPKLKFTLFYGINSGRYEKKVEVGNVREYRLRGLTNHQVYYVKIQGNAQISQDADTADSKAVELVLFSNEMTAIPLPEDEQGSQLEKSFARKVTTLQDDLEVDPFKRELKQFGYDFFRNSLSTGMMTDNLPVGGDYIIGPGDALRIDLWGTVQARYDATVDRNGEISLPKVGTVKVWGISYAQAKEVINKAISRYFKGYELNVTLGRLRTIQVFVVGEVESPGTYSVSSLATVINALSQAGGPSSNGSLRTIRLLRGGKVVQEIDLYDMLLGGDRSKDLRLENGDTIFVPVIGPVAALAGEVKRPAIYELKGKTNLFQMLQLAGGIAASGDTGRLQVERIEGNSARVVLDYEPKAGQMEETLGRVEILDRDMIKVFPVFKAMRHVVSLKGNVARPGEYQYKNGMRLSDLIPSYMALLPDAYLESAEITRLAAPDFHKESLSVSLRKALDGDQKENILLQEQDTVRVFSRVEMEEKPVVSINGQVLNPGTYDYYPRMTVRDLVAAAGSLKRNAYLDNAELTRIDVVKGKAESTRKDINLKKALAGDPEQNLPLQPDDVLIVRGIVEWLDTTDRFVVLKGEFKFPGTYSIAKGEKLDSVIARAGGYSDKAYLKGAKFTRKSVQESQQKRMDEVTARSEQEILKKQGELASVAASKEELEATKASLEGLMKGLEKLKQLKAEGRIVVRLVPLSELPQSSYNLELMGGDVLEIPQTPNVVNVMGQVYNPTTFVHAFGSNVSSYLNKAGGPTRDAEEGEMYIIRADGSVDSRHQSTFGIRWDEYAKRWTFGSFMSKPMEPGDTLVVPQILERTAWLRDIKDLTTIISQVALTAGTVLIGLR